MYGMHHVVLVDHDANDEVAASSDDECEMRLAFEEIVFFDTYSHADEVQLIIDGRIAERFELKLARSVDDMISASVDDFFRAAKEDSICFA
nr:hypothetical protein TetV2_00122 [Oceanusvirus sp.]